MEHATLYDVLTAWAPTIAAIVAALIAYSARTHSARAVGKLEEVDLKLNGRFSQLIAATEKAAYAAGEAAEQARVARELLKSKSEDG